MWRLLRFFIGRPVLGLQRHLMWRNVRGAERETKRGLERKKEREERERERGSRVGRKKDLLLQGPMVLTEPYRPPTTSALQRVIRGVKEGRR
jgi:hypothetical protein